MRRTPGGLWFEEHGEPTAPPLLLIMGLSLTARGWDRLPALLAPRFRVLAFDNRGTGRSAGGGFPFHMSQLADDAASVLDAAGVPRAHVFGISMGGMIAQELTLRHPARVDRLALGCTFACFRTSVRPGHRLVLDLLLLNALAGFRPAARAGRVLVSRAWHAAHPGGALEWLRRAEPARAATTLAQLLAIRRHACEDRLARIAAPTLVVTGSEDRLIPPANSALLAERIPGARLAIVEGAGHAFPLEAESETVRLLTGHFLAGGEGGPARSTVGP